MPWTRAQYCPSLETHVSLNTWLVVDDCVWITHLPMSCLLLTSSSIWWGLNNYLIPYFFLSLFQIIDPYGISMLRDHFHQNYSCQYYEWNNSLILSWTHENVYLELMNDQMLRTQTSSSLIFLQFSLAATNTQHSCSAYILFE